MARHYRVCKISLVYQIVTFIYTDLKDIVGQFDSEVQNKHQEVTHLKHENTKLQKSLHEKEEKLRKR